MAAAIYLKNLIRKYWKEESEDGNPDYSLSVIEQSALKHELLNSLINFQFHASVSQIISECIAQIALKDFPANQWAELLPVITCIIKERKATTPCALQILSTLVFRYRKEFRSDALFTEINVILEALASPLFSIFITPSSTMDEIKERKILLEIFYSLSIQDIPAFFEENFPGLIPVIESILLRGPSIKHAEEQEAAQVAACEFIRLYVLRYEEEVGESLVPLVVAIMKLLSAVNPGTLSESVSSEALGVVAAVLRLPRFKTMFEDSATLSAIIERIILPALLLQPSDEEAAASSFQEGYEWALAHCQLHSDERPPLRRDAAEEVLRSFVNSSSSQISLLSRQILLQFIGSAQRSSDWRVQECSLVVEVVVTQGQQDLAVLFDRLILLLQQISPSVGFLAAGALRSCAILLCRSDFLPSTQQKSSLFPILFSVFLLNANPIVHIAAVSLIETALRKAGPPDRSIVPTDLTTRLLLMVENLYLKNEERIEPDVLIRLVARLYFLTEGFPPQTVEVVSRMASMVGESPKNPAFTHWIWEILGLLSLSTEASSSIGLLIATSIQRNMSEFLPYAFLTMSVLVARGNQVALFAPLASGFLNEAPWEGPLIIPLGRAVESFIHAGLLSTKEVLELLDKVLLGQLNSTPTKMVVSSRIIRVLVHQHNIVETGASSMIGRLVGPLFSRRPVGIKRRLLRPLLRMLVHLAAFSPVVLRQCNSELGSFLLFCSESLVATSVPTGSKGEISGFLQLYQIREAPIPWLAECAVECAHYYSSGTRPLGNALQFLEWSSSSIRLMASEFVDLAEDLLSRLKINSETLKQELLAAVSSARLPVDNATLLHLRLD